MKLTKIDPKIQKTLQSILKRYSKVGDIVHAIDRAEGRALLVGGAVRDLLLDLETKDLDIEVYGLSINDLEKILKKFNQVSLVGKAFGVLRLHGLNVDWSMPRKDTSGRKPHVEIDPEMLYKDAFRRRDLTINAMGIDLITLELIDPFGGMQDLQMGILRAPSTLLFIQDPLRFYRVMQFIGRFDMKPDDKLCKTCKQMDISKISVERIEVEFKKLLLKSKYPSLGIRWLEEIGRLQQILPELATTITIAQDPNWHPEGNVFEHTMKTIDAAAAIECNTDFDKLVLMYAALCHDLGKPATTQKIKGLIKSEGHAQQGVAPTKTMMKRITRNKSLIDTVCKLVHYHMAPVQFVDGGAKLSAYKRLANKLAPHTNLRMLANLTLADKRGRNPHGPEPLTGPQPEVEVFLQKAQEAKVTMEKELPILHGRDLMDVVKPGPKMGELLKRAYEIQIEEGIKDRDELKRRVLSNDGV